MWRLGVGYMEARCRLGVCVGVCVCVCVCVCVRAPACVDVTEISKNRAKPLKGGQKLPWAKIDPWMTKGLVEKIRVGHVQRWLTQPFGETLLRRVAKIRVAEKIRVAKKLGMPKNYGCQKIRVTKKYRGPKMTHGRPCLLY